jgi:hypothetical protein
MIKVTPELCEVAQELIRIYDQVPGSSGPYCNPPSLAAVLREIGNTANIPQLITFSDLLSGEQ